VTVAGAVAESAGTFGATVLEVSASSEDGSLEVEAVLQSERQLRRDELETMRLAVEEVTDLPVVFTAHIELITTVGGDSRSIDP